MMDFICLKRMDLVLNGGFCIENDESDDDSPDGSTGRLISATECGA